jgi:hypothetical protein
LTLFSKSSRKKDSFSSHARKVKRVGLRVVRVTACWHIKNTRRDVMKSVLCEESRVCGEREQKCVLCASANSICDFASLVFTVINKLIKHNFFASLPTGPGIKSDIYI